MTQQDGAEEARFSLDYLFDQVAKSVPDKPAIIFGDRTVSYRELNANAALLARAFANSGLERGDMVGLYLQNCPEYVETLLACFRVGAIPFNINYRYGEEELAYLVGDSGAKALVFNAEYAEMAEKLANGQDGLDIPLAVGDGASFGENFDEFRASASEPAPSDGREDDIFMLYTGGTTGMPKGVLWPHRGFFFACLGGGGHFHMSRTPIGSPDEIGPRATEAFDMRVLTIAPLMHGAAIWTALAVLTSGITLVLNPESSFDPEKLWGLIERERVNIVQIVGDAMAVPLRDALREEPERWSLDHVMHLGSGGAIFSGHVKAELNELLPNAMMGDGMGSSETGISGMAEPAKDGEGIMRLPANEEQAVIVDNRVGKVGEMGFIGRTGNIPVGYHGDEEKTAETFPVISGKRWAVTGDRGRLDEDGMITMFGRGSTCINSGGEKIYPEEVEECLRAHPAIMDSAVIGLPDERWGQKVTALVSIRDGFDRPETSDIQDHCRAALSGYKVPREILVADEIARSPAGKQDYRWAKSFAEEALGTVSEEA